MKIGKRTLFPTKLPPIQLCKSIETVPVPAGQYLFRVGDPDDCIYVVQTGKVVTRGISYS